MKNVLSSFLRDESGVTAIEYGLIAALVGVAIIAGATLLGGQLNDTLVYIQGRISDAQGGGGDGGGDGG
jgi:pilus assembly protein Flp/PilA